MKVVGHDTWVVCIPYEEHRSATHIVLQLNTDDGAQGVSYLTRLLDRRADKGGYRRAHGKGPWG